MDEKQLLEIGAWLNTLGYDIEFDKDGFWFEDWNLFSEHTGKNIMELMEAYHQAKLKLLNIPDVSNSVCYAFNWCRMKTKKGNCRKNCKHYAVKQIDC